MTNRNHNDPLDWVALFLLLCLVAVAIYVNGCSTMEHRQEALQREHPDCFVFPDLRIECPDPFDTIDSGAGFGIETQYKKIKVPKKPKRKAKK